MKKLMGSLLAAALGTCGLVEAEPLSLSINFAGGRKDAAPYGDVSGTDYFGAYSVPGSQWNNVRAYTNTDLGSFVWSDGVARDGVTLTTVTGCNWTTGKAPGIFYSYLDSGTSKPDITLAGFTEANGFPTNVSCTVYVYMATDSSSCKLYAVMVNDVQYTGANYATSAGDTAWGSSEFGKSGVLEQGGDYLCITGVTPDADGKIHIVSNDKGSSTYRGGVCAVQLVFDQPGVTATCREGMGTVSVDGGTGAIKVGKNGDFGSTVTATLTAAPAANYAFTCWTGDTAAISEGAATDATITVTADAAKRLVATFEPASDRREVVLSVNFSGERKVDTVVNPIATDSTCGHYPVSGSLWNNLGSHVATNLTGLVWNIETPVEDVTLTYTSNWNYTDADYTTTVGTPFYSYLDDYNPTVTFSGLTAANGFAETCTVCLYFACDSVNVAFTAPTVNGTSYTYADGRAVAGTNTWGSVTRSHDGTAIEGGNYLVIPNVPVTDGQVNLATINQGGLGARGGIAAVQLAFNLARAVTVTATSADATLGKVQFGDDAAAATASTTADDAVTATLRAVPEPGYAFRKWTGATWAIADGTATSAEVTLNAKMPGTLTAEFVADTVVATATWTGGGDRANASDPANWDCRTASGTVLVDALPTTDTEIVVEGDTTFNLPSGQSFLSRTFAIGDCRLTADCDWRGFGSTLQIDGTVDLNGHKLWVAGLTGTGTITDRKGEPDETATLSINFNGTRSSKGSTAESLGTVSGTTTYGAVEVAGANWNNIPAKDTSNQGGLVWNDGTTATGLALTAGNNGVVYTTGTTASEGTLFYSYLDDASVHATVSGLTTANGILSGTCTVYVYMSTDAASKKFKAVTVNGSTYSFVNSIVQVSTNDWGSTENSRNGQLVRGGNYLEILNVAISPTGTVDIASLKTDNASVARGGIAAIQIAGLRRTTEALTGELHVDVPAGTTLVNTTVTLDGALKLVKDGAGTFVATKAGQSYAGGTEIAVGGLTLGTSTEPLGAGRSIRTVKVDAGATLDYAANANTTGSRYNFVLDGGTIHFDGQTRGSGWNTSMAGLASITLTADSQLAGRYFFLGHDTVSTPITFNGYTLTLDNQDYVYSKNLVAQDVGTLAVNGGQLEFSANINFARADLSFGPTARTLVMHGPDVYGFSYVTNVWTKHDAASPISVIGTYRVGANRPPLNLLDGATLDFADWPAGTVWDSTGVESVSGTGNDKTYTTPGLVSFATNATYTVAVGSKVFPSTETKIVNWTAAPEGTTFVLDPEARKKDVLRVKDDGLYIVNVGGLVIILR